MNQKNEMIPNRPLFWIAYMFLINLWWYFEEWSQYEDDNWSGRCASCVAWLLWHLTNVWERFLQLPRGFELEPLARQTKN
jgi:hypothetical protein